MGVSTVQLKFLHELQDIYDAEHQFLEAMQEMAQQASNQQLKSGIEQHIQQTQQQIQNLQQVFSQLGEQPQRVTCDSAQGLVSEARKGIQESESDQVRDGFIAGGSAKVEHYEIAGYRSLVIGARLMGHQDAQNLLQQNLQQEEQTAQQLEQMGEQLLQQALQSQM